MSIDEVRPVINTRIHPIFKVEKIINKNTDGSLEYLRKPITLTDSEYIFKNFKKTDHIGQHHDFLSKRHLVKL